MTPALDGLAGFGRDMRAGMGALPFDLAVVAVAFVIAGAMEVGLSLLGPGTHGLSYDEPTFARRAFDAGFAWFRDHPFRAFVSLAYHWRYVTVALAVSALIVAAGFVFSPRRKRRTSAPRFISMQAFPRPR
ncbi:hypothetical protein [Breoghania sp.]|uniref:hypothetical protein n=1 Tax=Breoghania sp. TaxID=2065378 RepID=UPI00260DBAA6|nr:hypothetical protein [Breoghania sp.]MDJ0932910.1 hypothetical protein [Breoghania sp.]